MKGIKETKEVLDLGLGLGMAVKGALLDGKLGLEDLALLMPIVPLVGPAVDNVEEIPHELKDMDASEAAELVAHVKGKLGDSKPELIAAASLKAGLAIAELIKEITAEEDPAPEAA